MIHKNRALYIFQYLWEHTDEEHPATTKEIIEYLASIGISTTRKTVAEDAAELQNSGFDVVCNRSRQNEYFIGSRYLELAELKLLIDAVQAAKFISPNKSRELIGKVSALAGPHQSAELKRNLFMDGKVKTANEAVYYAVDTLYTAIQTQKAVSFQYIEYTADKEKAFKHNGQIYVLSPYDMVWNNDGLCVRLFRKPRQGRQIPCRPGIPSGPSGPAIQEEAGGVRSLRILPSGILHVRWKVLHCGAEMRKRTDEGHHRPFR